jgi:hypothetical protein
MRAGRNCRLRYQESLARTSKLSGSAICTHVVLPSPHGQSHHNCDNRLRQSSSLTWWWEECGGRAKLGHVIACGRGEGGGDSRCEEAGARELERMDGEEVETAVGQSTTAAMGYLHQSRSPTWGVKDRNANQRPVPVLWFWGPGRYKFF